MRVKRVALLIETSSSWGSLIIAGIGDYMRRHERWVLLLDHRGMQEELTLPPDQHVDGVIARVTSLPLAESVLKLGVPCVNVSQIRVPVAGIQQVTSNQPRVGQMAAEAMIATGLRNFAYYGPPPREYYTDSILSAFRDSLARAGHALTVIDRAAVHGPPPHGSLDLTALARAVERLPRPVGTLCWNALGAHHLNEACVWSKISVPDEVSILGGDYDLLTTELSTPRLTCLDQVPRRVGFLAAAELTRLMNGGAVRDPQWVEPEGIVPGESMATSAIGDVLVAEALEYITANAGRNINIQDVLDAVPTSRRNLERRFRDALGHGPATEIRRRRLLEARRLLAETDLPVKAIAAQCGFSNPEQLQRLFRVETSFSPSEYREAHRRPRLASGQTNGP